MMGKKLRRGILGLAMLGAFLLGACQPTPEKEIVVNKNDGALESAIAASAQPGENPATEERWQDEFSRKNFTVTVDAKIVTPETDSIPLYHIRSRAFTQEELEKFTEVFFGDRELYKYEEYTKEDYEDALIYAKQTLEKMIQGDPSVIDPGEPLEDQIANMEQEVKAAEERLAAAPEDNVGEKVTVGFEEDEYGNILFEACAEVDGALAQIYVDNNIDDIPGRSAMSFDRNIDERVGEEPANGEPSISLEEAETEARALLEKLGAGEVVLENAFVVKGGKDHYLHHLTFARAYDGIPMTLVQGVTESIDENYDGRGEEYSRQFDTEQIDIVIDENGVDSIAWKFPCEVLELANENVPVKSLEEAEENFKNYIFVKRLAQAGEETTVDIEEIRLSYALLRIKDGPEGEFYTAPVWDFIGSIAYASEKGMEPFEEGVSLVTINGLDGSNYDRILKY